MIPMSGIIELKCHDSGKKLETRSMVTEINQGTKMKESPTCV